MKKLILLAALFSAAANGQTICSKYGNTEYCSDGSQYSTYGNVTSDNRGNEWRTIGNVTYDNHGNVYPAPGYAYPRYPVPRYWPSYRPGYFDDE